MIPEIQEFRDEFHRMMSILSNTIEALDREKQKNNEMRIELEQLKKSLSDEDARLKELSNSVYEQSKKNENDKKSNELVNIEMAQKFVDIHNTIQNFEVREDGIRKRIEELTKKEANLDIEERRLRLLDFNLKKVMEDKEVESRLRAIS